MAILCPTHKQELAISEQHLTILNNEQKVTIGICPTCKTHYVNYIPFGNSTSFTLKKQRYQLLESLRAQFPPSPPVDMTSKQGTEATETVSSKRNTPKTATRLGVAKKKATRSNKKTRKTTPNDRLLKHFLESGGTAMVEGENTPSKVALWVYRLKRPCPSHSTSVRTTSVMVLEKQTQQWFPMLCLYCERCDRYYVNSESFFLYTKKYGIPMAELKYSTLSSDTYQNWAEESVLHFLGYNVNQLDNLSTKERQYRLQLAIEGEFIAKAQAITFLEGLIRRHKNNPKYNLAVKKWEDDLWFLLHNSVQPSNKYVERIIPAK